MNKGRGHFCWCCGRVRANERFSGAGHARHLCKDCHRLGAQELEYRQAVRDIDPMVQWETGRIKRKQRTNFERFLRHPNERVRRYAEDVAAGRVGVAPVADAFVEGPDDAAFVCTDRDDDGLDWPDE